MRLVPRPDALQEGPAEEEGRQDMNKGKEAHGSKQPETALDLARQYEWLNDISREPVESGDAGKFEQVKAKLDAIPADAAEQIAALNLELAGAKHRLSQLTPDDLTDGRWACWVKRFQDACDMKHEDSRSTFGIEWMRHLLARLAKAQAREKELDAELAKMREALEAFRSPGAWAISGLADNSGNWRYTWAHDEQDPRFIVDQALSSTPRAKLVGDVLETAEAETAKEEELDAKTCSMQVMDELREYAAGLIACRVRRAKACDALRTAREGEK